MPDPKWRSAGYTIKTVRKPVGHFFYYNDVRKIRNTFNVVSSLNQKYSSLFTIQHNISDISLKMAPWRGNKRLRRLVSPRGGNPWLLLQPTYWSNPDTLEFTRKHFRSTQSSKGNFRGEQNFAFFKFLLQNKFILAKIRKGHLVDYLLL